MQKYSYGSKQYGENRFGPNGKYCVWKHIINAEKAIGKPLPKGAEVHHINGNMGDNRNENLIVCQDRAYHRLLHQRQLAFNACGHATWRKCWICQKYDAPENLCISTKSVRHSKCHNEYRIKFR